MIRKGTINIKSETDFSSINIVYRGSAALETPGNFGLSHLLEHLICESYKHMEETLQRLSIYANAFTSDNTIVFQLYGLNYCIEQVKDEYIKCITNPDMEAIIEKKFETERKIVLQEYDNCFTTPLYAHHYNLHRKLYKHYGPIGLRSDLENLTPEKVMEHYIRQFHKPTSIIYVSKEDKLPDDIVQYGGGEILDTADLEGYNSEDMKYELGAVTENQSSVLMFSPIIQEDFAVVDMLCYMLGGGLISPLYQEVREKRGLVYFIWCFPQRIDDNTVIVEIGSEVNDENAQAFLDAVNHVLMNKDEHLTQDLLDRAKEYYTVKSQKDKILRHSNVDKFIDPMGQHIEDNLDDISLQKIHEVFDKYFAPGNWYESIDKQEFPRMAAKA